MPAPINQTVERKDVMLKPFAALGTVHRGEPCKEYPGQWLVFSAGKELPPLPSFDEAYSVAYKECIEYDKHDQQEPIKVSICWKASDDDPRIGEVWFTGFYQHGKFNQFGSYVT